ncbi:MAG: CapA family protein [Acetobacterales bacterium]
MRRTVLLLGDINLLGVADPEVPFARVADTLARADVVLANLECCFYEPDGARDVHHREGFYASPRVASALRLAHVDAVGHANNVTYGADAIRSTLDVLDAIGMPHTGAGLDAAAARAPAVVEHEGLRIGFLQRTSVFWPTDHIAGPNSPGVATIRGHTAYRPRMEVSKAATRPGAPPEILTWADRGDLDAYLDDLRALRGDVDLLVASQHWGYGGEVLEYQSEIAHAVIDAGADVVMGHGPHESLPVEIYRDRPIFYGLGGFSFDIGHRGRKHGDWLGMMPRLVFDGVRLVEAAFRPVRHNERNETWFPRPASERDELLPLAENSHALGATLEFDEEEILVRLPGIVGSPSAVTASRQQGE